MARKARQDAGVQKPPENASVSEKFWFYLGMLDSSVWYSKVLTELIQNALQADPNNVELQAISRFVALTQRETEATKEPRFKF